MGFEEWLKEMLLGAKVNHADETGINIGGKRVWLHNLSNDQVTFYHPDIKRGHEAMDRMGVLPKYVAFFAMTTGNHTSIMIVFILCAMPITYVN